MRATRSVTVDQAHLEWLTALLTAAWRTLLLMGLIHSGNAAEAPCPAAPQAPSATSAVADPLGRNTPIGTMAGFTSAVRRENFSTAERYMQLTQAQRFDAEPLARDLTALIDRYFMQPLTTLSPSPEGTLDDTLPPDRDRLTLSIGGKSVDIELVRVSDSQGNRIWLISSETLSEVPSLRAALHPTWLQDSMPRPLVAHSLFGISLAQWIAYAASIAAPWLILWLVSRLVIRVARANVKDASRHRVLDSWGAGLAGPLIVAGTLAVHLTAMRFLGFPLTFRLVYLRCALVVVVVVFAWLLWRLLTLSAAEAELVAQRRGHPGTRSVMLLGERVLKVLIVVLTILGVLTIAGVNTTTALAGLGIGGIAVALGAQKSIENLLGGVFLLTDKALAVGDMCRVSDRMGWIEDITLRSVRLRTVEQTLLSIPAGALAQANIENFATRGKVPVQTTLRLPYATNADQLRKVLASVQGMLDGHAQLERGTARIRLVGLGAQAFELELFAYVMTADARQFLAVREELLLKVAEMVESSGTAFTGA